MRLHLDAHVVIVVEGDDAGVVGKHRAAVILLAALLADPPCRLLYIGLVKVVYLLDRARGLVLIRHAGGEDLVLAVLGPGLGQDLHLGIRRVRTEPVFAPAFPHVRTGEPVLYGLHFLERERQGMAAAVLQERRVIHLRNGDGEHLVGRRPAHGGGLRLKAGLSAPFLPALQAEALDQLVAQHAARDGLGILALEPAPEMVLRGRVDSQGMAVAPQHQGRGIARCAAFVVGDAGAEAHLADPVRIGIHGRERGLLQHGIVQGGPAHQVFRLFAGDSADGEHLDHAGPVNGEGKRLAHFAGDAAAYGISLAGMDTDFDAEKGLRHGCLPGLLPCGRERREHHTLLERDSQEQNVLFLPAAGNARGMKEYAH